MVIKTEPEIIKELFESLINSDFIGIPKEGKINISNNQGVYIIFDNEKRVLHVGKTTNGKMGLDQRLLNHVRNQSSFSKLYMQKNQINLRDWGFFKFIEVNSPRTRSLLEALTAGMLCPAHIGTGLKV